MEDYVIFWRTYGAANFSKVHMEDMKTFGVIPPKNTHQHDGKTAQCGLGQKFFPCSRGDHKRFLHI